MRRWFIAFVLTGMLGSTAGAQTWQSLGPDSVMTKNSAVGTSAGRVSALAFSPHGRLIAASAAGGLWKYVPQPGVAHVAWQPIGDKSLPSAAFGELASSAGMMIAATGEGHWCDDCLPGKGIAWSDDDGDTWNARAAPRDAYGITARYSIAVAMNSRDHDNVWLATERGVFESVTRGRSWEQRFECQPVKALPGHCVTALVLDPIDPTVAYAADSHGVFALAHGAPSTKTPAYVLDATTVPGAITDDTADFHIALAATSAPGFAAPFRPSSVLYAAFSSRLPTPEGSCALAVFRRGGDTKKWIALKRPQDYTSTKWAYDDPRAMCLSWYANVIRVNPADANDVIVGGINLLRYYGDPLGVGGWEDLTSRYHIHRDIHDIMFGRDGWVYIASDGGVDRLTRVTAEPLNDGLVITQFNPGASVVGPQHAIAAGTQDNGTLLLAELGDPGAPTHWQQILGGDGGYVSVGATDPFPILAEMQAGTLFAQRLPQPRIAGLIPVIRQSPSPLEPDADQWRPVHMPSRNVAYWAHAGWVMPFRRSRYDLSHIFSGADTVYRSTDGGTTFTPTDARTRNGPFAIFDNVTALDTCDNGGERVVAGWSTGLIRGSQNAGVLWFDMLRADDANGLQVADVTFDRTDPDSVFAVLVSGDKTQDTIDPDPTKSVPWAVRRYSFTDPAQSNAMPGTDFGSRTVSGRPIVMRTFPGIKLLGTTTGVYQWSEETSAWIPFGDGLPQVPVVDLLYIERFGTDGTFRDTNIIAVTHGRGMWRLMPGWQAQEAQVPSQCLRPGNTEVTDTALRRQRRYER